ncbi:glucagon receptor isoform X2 [Acipenser ruthenus]|uniref:glucagon receptor isoform X2 n=1 Tax=Acipenser ruthenus TaxID=7906 RepID=UPI00145AE906|nr:glucagon receptor isoform X2 [Acipenser ruthenus]
MWGAHVIHLLTVSVLWSSEIAAGKMLKDTLEEWKRYHLECHKKMMYDPYPPGVFCNRTFDMYACWSDGLPNTTAKVPCPWYLPWHDQVRNGFVFWYCGSDGQWLINSSGYPLRDFSQCELDDSLRKAQEEQMRLLAYFRVMYTVGYSLSLGALTLALAILLSFRKLRCTRNNIHSNLFASFMLRAISILTRDVLLLRQTRELRDHGDPTIMLSNQALTGCRLAQVLMQYCVGVNYYWLLVEGLYLHNLLVVMVFSEKSYFRCYLFIGWGTPVLFVVPWVVVRHLYEDTQCWEINENMSYWWIIRCPILVAILINFFIFIQIIHILISKLRAHQMRYTDYKFRLAKSTLTLIPLLGIHEVVFALLTEEQAKGTLRNVKFFFELFLNSFQGLLVAILYCFINTEVQSEIRKKWQRRNLGASLLEEHRNSCSKMPQGDAGKPRAGGAENGHCHHGPLYQSASQQQLDANTESHSSSDNSSSGPQHHHSGARKGKSFCYISTRKQPPKRLDCLPPSTSGAGEGSITAQCTESYC